MSDVKLRKKPLAQPSDSDAQKATAQKVRRAAQKRKENNAYRKPIIGLLVFTSICSFGYSAYQYFKPSIQSSPPPSKIFVEPLPWMRQTYQLAPLPSLNPGEQSLVADEEKRDAVREAFEWSWNAYERDAWGSDEYHPLSHTGSNISSTRGMGYTIIDSLDSLLVMGFVEEFERGVSWLRAVAGEEEEAGVFWDVKGEMNVFETTIRLLGGLLAAHYLLSASTPLPPLAFSPTFSPTSASTFLLALATDLGDRLLPAYSTNSGIPLSLVDLAERRGIPDVGNGGMSSLAEAGTVGLEMKYLSELTGDLDYWKKAERVMQVIKANSAAEGICPIFISPDSGQFVLSEIRLGSRGDSYYEYLIKQYLQTDRKETVYRDMYDHAMGSIKKLMINRSPRQGILYTQELVPQRTATSADTAWRIMPKQDHLVCFLGGSFLLGLTEGGRKRINWTDLSQQEKEDYQAGVGIIESCMAVHETATGLAPEIAMFWLPEEVKRQEDDWYVKAGAHGTNLIDGRNILRPETVESLFLAYRLTGEQKYRDYGWKIFKAFQRYCKVEDGGYAGVENVEVLPVTLGDKMETFWLAETLKYLYLLFDDEESIPLSSNVFNTEAHILPVFTPSFLSSFSRYS